MSDPPTPGLTVPLTVTGPVVPETKVAVTDEDALAEPWTTVRPPGDGVERLKSKAGGAAMVQRTA